MKRCNVFFLLQRKQCCSFKGKMCLHKVFVQTKFLCCFRYTSSSACHCSPKVSPSSTATTPSWIATTTSSFSTIKIYSTPISWWFISRLCNKKQQVIKSRTKLMCIFVFLWSSWNVFFSVPKAFSTTNWTCLCFLLYNISRSLWSPSLCDIIN
jgi:hypothetical protein